MCLKKSNKDTNSWADYLKFLYEWRKAETEPEKAARLDEKILDTSRRALQSLPQGEHKFFQMRRAGIEFKVGEVEKGRTTLETLISKLPSKGDIWNLYLDMEVKYGEDVETKRNLFKRAAALYLKPKIMQGFFTKWMQFEESVGDNKRIAEVKEQARIYIETKSKEVHADSDDEEPIHSKTPVGSQVKKTSPTTSKPVRTEIQV